MQTVHSNLNLMGSLNRMERRNLIETYCNYATFLPAHKRLLFLLYFRDGYSTIEISQLIMKHHTTVSRRLKRIAKELEDMISGDLEQWVGLG